MSTKDHIVVMAIDFGTTYSGYAFSLRSDFSKAIDNCLNQSMLTKSGFPYRIKYRKNGIHMYIPLKKYYVNLNVHISNLLVSAQCVLDIYSFAKDKISRFLYWLVTIPKLHNIWHDNVRHCFGMLKKYLKSFSLKIRRYARMQTVLISENLSKILLVSINFGKERMVYLTVFLNT